MEQIFPPFPNGPDRTAAGLRRDVERLKRRRTVAAIELPASIQNAPFVSAFGELLFYSPGTAPAFTLDTPYDWSLDPFNASNYCSDGTGITTGGVGGGANENDFFRVDFDSHPTQSYLIKEPGLYYIWGSLNIEGVGILSMTDPFWTGLNLISSSSGLWIPLASNHGGWQHWPVDTIPPTSNLRSFRHYTSNVIYVPSGSVSHSMAFESTNDAYQTTTDVDVYVYAGAMRLSGPTG